MIPIIRRASFPNQINILMLINNEPILIRSTQAAGIVRYMFAGDVREGEGVEKEMTGGYFYRSD